MVINKIHILIVTICIISLLEVCGNSMIVPILPKFSQYFDSTPIENGLSFISYQLGQIISCLVMGKLSDIYGRRGFLLLSLFGVSVGNFVQLICSNKWMFISARLLTGGFTSACTLSYAYIADCFSPDDRSLWHFRLTTFISFGFIVGPIIGSLLSQISLFAPILLLAVLNSFLFVFCCLFLDDSSKYYWSNALLQMDHTKNHIDLESIKVPLLESNDFYDHKDINRIYNQSGEELTDIIDDKNNIQNQTRNFRIESDYLDDTKGQSVAININIIPGISHDFITEEEKREYVDTKVYVSSYIYNSNGSSNYINEAHTNPYSQSYHDHLFLIMLSINILNSIQISSTEVIYPLYAIQHLNFNLLHIGAAFSLAALIMIMQQLILVELIHIYISYSYMTASFIFLQLISSGMLLCKYHVHWTTFGWILLCASTAPLESISQSTISIVSDPLEQGYYIGIIQSTKNFIRMIIPIILCYSYQLNLSLPFIINFVVSVIALIISIYYFQIIKSIPQIHKSLSANHIVQ